MKNIKTKLKQLLSIKTQFKLAVYFVGFSVITCSLVIATVNFYRFIKDPVGQDKLSSTFAVYVPNAKADDYFNYKYNDKIPVEDVKLEIIRQARKFGNDEKFMLDLAFCESGFNNLADNETSTAKGVYQFVANTWETTESNKNKISEFDYMANIREANIKIANNEYSHWRDCVNKIK